MGSNKGNYELVRHPHGKREINAWNAYVAAKRIEQSKVLAPSEKKRKSKALLTLVRFGILRQISDGEVRRRAEMIYKAMPLWKRCWLRIKFSIVWLFAKARKALKHER